MINDHLTISIGMPVYNGAAFIGEAIDSLLGQTYRDFELIISDNASTDETYEICQGYAQKDSRIRLLHQKVNRGASANFARVFHEARGRFFKWAAADDICLPHFLKSCVTVLQKNPNIVLCYPQTETFGLPSKQRPFLDADLLTSPSILHRVGAALSWAPVADYIFGVMRTEALKTTSLIGAFPSSDRVLLLELALQGQFHEVPEVMFKRRLHSNQSYRSHKTKRERAQWFTTNKIRGRFFPEWLLVTKYAKAILNSPHSLGTRLRCLFQLHHWFGCRWKSLVKELIPSPLIQLGKRIVGRKQKMGSNASLDLPSKGGSAGVPFKDHT